MKKLVVLVGMLTVLVLGACSNTSEDVATGNLDMPQATDTPGVLVDTENGFDDSVVGNVAHFSIHYLTWGGMSTYATLIDVTTGEVAGNFVVADNEIIWDILNFANGYFGVLVGTVSPADEFGFITDNSDSELRYVVFDATLEVVGEFAMTDEGTYGLGYVGSRMGSHAVFTGTELLIYYPFTTMQAAWYDSVQSIRRFNATTGETEILTEVTEVGLNLNRVMRVTPEIVAFTGNRTNVYGQLEYGFVNLTTGAVTVFSEPNFNANHSGFMTHGEHVLITEEFAPPTMGVPGGLSVLRGEVVVFNVMTGANRVINVGGIGSFWAILSGDGRYVVTIDENLNYLQKYDIATGNLAHSQRVDLDGSRVWQLLSATASSYLVQTASDGGVNPFEIIMLER